MNKKTYISPVADILEITNLHTLLVHFSAEADFLDYEEEDPSEIEATPIV